MESWIVAFLGIIALGSLVQTGLLVALGLLALRAGRYVSDTREQARREMAEPIEHLREATRHLNEIAEMLGEEARTVRQSAEIIRSVRTPWSGLTALAKGVARGVEAYRRP